MPSGTLIPKIFKENAVQPHELEITDEAIRDVIRYYTREAGVRNLERELATIARKAVKEILLYRGRDEHVRVDSGNLSKYLGVIKYRYGEAEEQDHVGVTTRSGLDGSRRRHSLYRSCGHAGQG